MNFRLLLLCLNLLVVFSVSMVSAQSGKASLIERWGGMLEQAQNYPPYKVIKKTELDYFWVAVKDSIGSYKMKLKKEKNTSAQQQSKINSLKKELDETILLLNASKDQSNSISYMGITANKYVYMSGLWLLIMFALVAIGYLFFLYKNSHVITREKTTAYEKVTDEFTRYKQAKLEQERKLKRELQTQLNLIEELRRLG
jgi:hypothetical protein